jgi:hypothetical protein
MLQGLALKLRPSPALCRAWTQPAYAQASAYGCVLAWQDLAYDEYKAADTNLTSMINMSNYNTDPRYANFKYGWTAYDCAVAYPYICQMRPEAFPCMPPPNPPSPPPLPPSPPSPPAPPSCKWPRLSSSAVVRKLSSVRGIGCAQVECSTALTLLL